MQIRTTVIIPNYNGLRFMEGCLESLDRQTVKDFRLLVIDNGSTDGSVEWLKEREIPTVFLEENTGFAGAVNVGIQRADTPFVILLNNDTVVDSRYVEMLEKAISRSERIFSVSSRMVQMSAPEFMDDAGDMYSVLGWAYQRGVGQPVGRYDRPARVFSACAGAAIYRRKVFEEIGLFDPMHFAYLEDIDIGYRAKLYGYVNVYCPYAKVLHVGSGTSGSKYNSFKVKLAARNGVYLNYKNMPGAQIVVNLPFLFAGMAVKYWFFVKMGFGKDYLDGVMEGLRTVGKCRKVPVKVGWIGRYVGIEMELLWGTLGYVWEFGRRQVGKMR